MNSDTHDAYSDSHAVSIAVPHRLLGTATHRSHMAGACILSDSADLTALRRLRSLEQYIVRCSLPLRGQLERENAASGKISLRPSAPFLIRAVTSL